MEDQRVTAIGVPEETAGAMLQSEQRNRLENVGHNMPTFRLNRGGEWSHPAVSVDCAVGEHQLPALASHYHLVNRSQQESVSLGCILKLAGARQVIPRDLDGSFD
jgi:hypothetical protein